MTQQLSDDKLVAYVVGELDKAEHKAVEKALKSDAAARHTVAELRATAKYSRQALLEWGPTDLKLSDGQREVIEKRARGPRMTDVQVRPAKRPWYRLHARQIVGLAAAVIVLAVLASIMGPRSARVLETAGLQKSISPFIVQHGLGLREDMGASLGAQPSFVDDPNLNYWPGHNTEAYDLIVENPFRDVTQDPLSTFSIDVDTASYANVRRFLNQGTLPPPDAVRIEELVNYFSYDYAPPDGDTPFSAHVEVAGCPWAPEHRLARVGLKGWEMAADERPASNLVFLLDVSGSMRPQNKLPLVKKAMRLLVKQLGENDRVAIAVYAGASGLVLPSTSCDDQRAVLQALKRLESGGSTNGGAGIQLAYDVATRNFIDGGVNRVILATDGDFNVGVTNQGELVRIIEEKAKSGVFLTVVGFGMGNVKDSTLEKLADKGNGNYAYIDTFLEARKVFGQQLGATLVTIAKDVKIQIEFNPAQVGAYRLIGYENRILAAEDFNDDTKDAGEIGAGHTVTALYELVPAGQDIDLPSVDPLRYQRQTRLTRAAATPELFTLKLRYKDPDADVSQLLSFTIEDDDAPFAQASEDLKFAASVAGFGMILRQSDHKGTATFDGVLEIAEEGLGDDRYGYRREFIELVRKAKALS